MMRLDHYKRVPVIGLSVAITAMLILAFFVTTLPFWLVATLIAVISAGNGTLLPVSTVAIQNAVALHQVGTVTGAMGFFRQLGGALMVAALGANRARRPRCSRSRCSPRPALRRAIRRPGALRRAPSPGLFGFAALILAGALGFLLRMRELPLRSGRGCRRGRGAQPDSRHPSSAILARFAVCSGRYFADLAEPRSRRFISRARACYKPGNNTVQELDDDGSIRP